MAGKMNKSQCVCCTSGSAGPTSFCSRDVECDNYSALCTGGALGMCFIREGLLWVFGAIFLSALCVCVCVICGRVYSPYT